MLLAFALVHSSLWFCTKLSSPCAWLITVLAVSLSLRITVLTVVFFLVHKTHIYTFLQQANHIHWLLQKIFVLYVVFKSSRGSYGLYIGGCALIPHTHLRIDERRTPNDSERVIEPYWHRFLNRAIISHDSRRDWLVSGHIPKLCTSLRIKSYSFCSVRPLRKLLEVDGFKMASQTKIRELSKNSANCTIGGTFEGLAELLAWREVIKRLQKFTDRIQVAITSRDVLIEKFGANTEFKLSFTVTVVQPSSSIEFTLSFRTDGDHSRVMYGLIELQKSL